MAGPRTMAVEVGWAFWEEERGGRKLEDGRMQGVGSEDRVEPVARGRVKVVQQLR